MLEPKGFIRVLAWSCFCAFLICALVAAITGVLLIWGSQEQFDGILGRTFLSAFLLTVITGLLVSGTRSMLGVVTDSEDG